MLAKRHAAPLGRHYVVAYLAHHMVKPVATHFYVFIHAAKGFQRAIHLQGSLVVKQQRHPWVYGQCCALVDYQRVIYQIRLYARQPRIGLYRVAHHALHILSPCRQGHTLLHAVGHEVYAVVHSHRLIVAGRVDVALHKHIHAVFASDFHVVKLIALHTIYVEVEFSLRFRGHFNRRHVNHLFASVIYDKLLCGSALACDYGVKLERVGRKRQHIGRRGAHLIAYAASHAQRQSRQHDKYYVAECLHHNFFNAIPLRLLCVGSTNLQGLFATFATINFQTPTAK